MIRRTPRSSLFPYTTLFRSHRSKATRAFAATNLVRTSFAADLTTFRRFGGLLNRVIPPTLQHLDLKSTRLNSSHVRISYAVFCFKKKNASRANSFSEVAAGT